MCAYCTAELQVSDIDNMFTMANTKGVLEKDINSYKINNKMDKVWKVMSGHPAYMTSFLKTHYTLLTGDGPLPASLRHFIAILASARFSCSFLTEVHKEELIKSGGKVEWVEQGLVAAPKKIQKLYELNKILAHRPWSLTKEHIINLTKPGEDNWSLSELVYAIVLMVHFHSFSSIIESCVLMEEATMEKTTKPAPNHNGGEIKDFVHRPPYDCSVVTRRSSRSPEIDKVDELLQKMETLKGKQENQEPLNIEELTVRFRTVERGTVLDQDKPEDQVVISDISQFVKDINFQYVDFAKRERDMEFPTFRVQDFNWDEEGFSMMSRYYSDIAQLLDDKFRIIYNMTYGTMGRHSSIDTSLFRRATWNYIQCLWGMRHDDYDYSEVNDLLHRNLKKYIKTASCYPERSSREEYGKIMGDFKSSEKIHLMMLTGEAKFQSCLLYSMRAISSYFNRS